MDLKVCSRCQQPKPTTEFRQAKMAADGRHPWCRPCDTDYARERRRMLRRGKPDHRHAWKAATFSPPSDPAQLGYFAGIIDGEGTIVKTRKPSGAWSPRVAVIMTHEPTIRWLGQFGGQVSALPERKDADGPRKPQWRWLLWTYADCQAILQAILPYLITKRETAETLLAEMADKQALAPSKT